MSELEPPICCYCDNSLSCAVCGKEQPADYPKAIAAELTRLRAQIETAEQACLKLCTTHGFATGHGDTVADLIGEIDGQIEMGSGEKLERGEPTLNQEATEAVKYPYDNPRDPYASPDRQNK